VGSVGRLARQAMPGAVSAELGGFPATDFPDVQVVRETVSARRRRRYWLTQLVARSAFSRGPVNLIYAERDITACSSTIELRRLLTSF
jgi:hypothetical protein